MSEDDKWDSDNFRADVQPKAPMGLMSNQWDGEDEEEEVKDSWDDPEEEEQEQDEESKENDTEENSTIKAVQVKKPKKLLAKIEEKERKLQEELENKVKQQKEAMTPEDVHAEKLRQQKLQEDADFELAKHLLGVNLKSDLPVLETKEDFDKYSEEILRQLGTATKNPNFFGFFEQLIQQLCVHLSATELKKIHTWVGNLQIEKHRMEQGTKSKKKGKGKAKLKLDDDTDIYSNYNEDVYDDFM